ncbi:MAG: hydroxymethylglutaryl-CoA reductase, degradative [Candidatus Bathyarchaeota archaeon]|nr:MAG: hydroxymethylglutaryl-CoA reductase, degradative [Candidatus Bathyarchaeota archaeon]
MKTSSPSADLHKLPSHERLHFVKTWANLTKEEFDLLRTTEALPFNRVNQMVENAIGVMPVPLGVATNFLINGKEYLIPMATEEPSVIAAASNGARMSRDKGGFLTTSTPPIMIGQIQVTNIENPAMACRAIFKNKTKIIATANEQDPILVSLGRGTKDIRVRTLKTITEPMVIVEILVDCGDAMGANAVNTMAEAVAPLIETITNGDVRLRIISNLADLRLAKARCIIANNTLGGKHVVDKIIQAYVFALADPYRCSTHNKGVMNGISAVVLATGNDTRSIEAGAHAYAAKTGKYLPLTTWTKNENYDLVGTIELPMAVGIVGGATRAHPVAKMNVKILGVQTASELGEVIAAVGLAQNLAALRALAVEGIQRGHMKLHARNVAMEAGATGDTIDVIAKKMVQDKKIRLERAKQLLIDLLQ